MPRRASIITTTRALVALALALALSLARPVFASPSPDRREITGIVVVDRATGTFADSITRRRARRGANAYWLRFASMGNERERENVHKTLDAMHDLGLDVVRTWAFMDGNENHSMEDLRKGREAIFENRVTPLDRLLTTCREKNLRVILTLTNYWPDYGGIDRYVEWAREEGDENARRREDFYTSTKCPRAQFKPRYDGNFAGRRNTVTGELYRDDPTIFSYQLINEPRVRGDTSDGAVFEEWVRAFAETIRRVDGGRHLVTALARTGRGGRRRARLGESIQRRRASGRGHRSIATE